MKQTFVSLFKPNTFKSISLLFMLTISFNSSSWAWHLKCNPKNMIGYVTDILEPDDAQRWHEEVESFEVAFQMLNGVVPGLGSYARFVSSVLGIIEGYYVGAIDHQQACRFIETRPDDKAYTYAFQEACLK